MTVGFKMGQLDLRSTVVRGLMLVNFFFKLQ